MKITVIKPTSNKSKGKKRVAAYARVSTMKEEQEESFETQIAYYSTLITANPDYEFVGMYADQGISATQMKTRPEFMRLVGDAKAGKIDVIYCKSISRFCRNAADCQHIVHELKEKMVEVIFEKEQLSTFNPMSEMVFNFMTIIAQEESRSISENIVWALDRLAEKGIRHLGPHRVFGYTEIDGKLVPDENANVVKFIFDEYTSGIRTRDIIKHLNILKIRSHQDKRELKSSDIHRILKNVIYKGDRIIQKKPHPDYITHKPDYTKEFAQYYVTDAHEPLVSKEMWEKAQNIKEEHKRDIYFYSRNKVEKIKEEAIQVRSTSHPLWGKLICGECGEPFQRMTVNSGGVNKHFWNCLGRKKKNGCLNHGIMETVIFEKINEVDLNKIDKILIYKDKSIEIKEKTLPIEIVQFYERARLYNLI